MTPDCEFLERTHAFADGELTGADAEAARAHLATCAACRAELADVLQLDAIMAQRPAPVVSLAWYRRRKVQLAGVALAAAAGVAVYLALPRAAPVGPDAVAVVLAPHRMTEARLAWRGAAAYRPYDVARAAEAPHETIDLMAIAQLERRGDAHGVGVLELLNGERRQAASYLERAGDAPDVTADRAALALAAGQPAQALALADAALARDAHHGAALWNRALALRDLGLARAAALAFRAVAARGEPGWADEATRRAGALDAEVDALQQRYDRITAASAQFARGKNELALDDARAQPGFARAITYDAIRSAQTPAQLDALAPLVQAIDDADRDTALHDALARARAALHPALSKQYAELIRSLAVEMFVLPKAGDELPVPAGPARARLLDQLRAAHADDLLIGVLMKLNDDRYTVNANELAEFLRLTAASPDPWMQMLGVQHQAQVALKANDFTAAEAALLRGKARCTSPGMPAFRCISISRLLGDLYIRLGRWPEARTTLTDAWNVSRSSSEWLLQLLLLPSLAQVAAVGDDIRASGLPLVRGYVDELVQRYPKNAIDDRCHTEAWGRDLQAMLLLDQLEPAAAQRALAGAPCGSGGGPVSGDQVANHAYVRAALARDAGPATDVAPLRAEIAALRGSPAMSPANEILLDHAEGRLLIDRDPAAADAALRRALEAAKALPASNVSAHMTAGWSYALLAVARVQRGEGDAALALLAEEQAVTLPKQCVLGVALVERRRAIAARDARGTAITYSDEGRTSLAIDPTTLVPPTIRAALADCPTIDVIARPPIQGMSRLFDDQVAWRYLAQRSRPVGAMTGPSITVANVEPPTALELPALAPWSSQAPSLSGTAATPSRVLAAIGAAGDVVIHAHGLVDVAQPDASFLALSPEPGGRFALTTGDVRGARFAASPLVILAACRSAQAAPIWHQAWSLPVAFIYAGARAVIASSAPVADRDAAEFFDLIRSDVRAGRSAATALRDVRQRWLAERRSDWVRDVIVFE